MKVYVVTSGEYSDYNIDAVFIDRTKAEHYIKLCGGQLEEYDTMDDIYLHKLNYREGFTPFKIWYRVSDNSFTARQESYPVKDKNYCCPVYDGSGWWIYCLAKDEKHALKISSERISQMKALNLIGLTFDEFNKLTNPPIIQDDVPLR